MREVHMMYSL